MAIKRFASAVVLLAGALIVGILGGATPARADTLMSVDSFVSAYKGKPVDLDGQRTGVQCVDLAGRRNIKKKTGGTHWIWGNGRDWWTSTDSQLLSNYTKVSASATAQKGDIAVWGSTGSGTGHVAIVLADKGSSLYTLSQSSGGRVELRTIATTYVLYGNTQTLRGYWRPKRFIGSSTPKVFAGHAASTLSVTTTEVRLTVCADNLPKHTVYAVLSRPGRTWSAVAIKATGRCVTFTNMDGVGNTFSGVTYTTRAALNQKPSMSWPGSGCYAYTKGLGLCDSKRR